jgi:hypothetical protein
MVFDRSNLTKDVICKQVHPICARVVQPIQLYIQIKGMHSTRAPNHAIMEELQLVVTKEC